MLALVLLGSCAAPGGGDTTVPGAAGLAVAPIVTTTTTTVPTTTTAAPITTIPGRPSLPGLGPGSRGPDVLALEQRLADLRYDPGKVDGTFDWATHHGVMAFQKVQSLPRSGRATDDVLNLITQVGAPGPMLPDGGADRVEVDLHRQVLFLYRAGALNKILSISTGSGRRYCVEGQCAVAVTPGGSFRVSRRIAGWRTSRLGKLYNPLYFNGGIAIHGAPSVPAYPASHGCVRIPMSSAGWFPGMVPNGTPVYVLGGHRAAVPFNEQAPGEGDPAASSTTTAPSTTTTTGPGAATTTTVYVPTRSTTTTAPSPTTTTTAPPS
ncbi:MAG: L,D-transpeptidase family protein [Actinobacteria bacterium]|nr:L,D-transpeptidase family protein [Actinomycetota bacterium]